MLPATLSGNPQTEMEIILIAAVDKKFHIGNDNSIPWNIPLDRRIFRHITSNYPVIMGRKTFEAIGHPLKKRKNIILTRDRNFKVNNGTVVHSVEEALKTAKCEKVFVIGGEKIYRLFLPLANKIYITHIDSEFEGNKFFPDLKKEDWEVIKQKDFYHNGIKLTFVIYSRKNWFS